MVIPGIAGVPSNQRGNVLAKKDEMIMKKYVIIAQTWSKKYWRGEGKLF